jgi:hypothetical protein
VEVEEGKREAFAEHGGGTVRKEVEGDGGQEWEMFWLVALERHRYTFVKH